MSEKNNVKGISKNSARRSMRLPRAAVSFVLGLIFLSGVAAFVQAGGTALFTGERPAVKIALSAVVERDKEKLSLEKAGTVKPNEVLEWTIVSANEGAAAANEYKTVGQIPAGTVFVEGSARGERAPAVAYSIDNGKSFSAQPVIDEKQADGTIKQVPAPASMFTQVRFEWQMSLNPGEKLSAIYKVRVRQ